jgi:hypothetical protein
METWTDSISTSVLYSTKSDSRSSSALTPVVVYRYWLGKTLATLDFPISSTHLF